MTREEIIKSALKFLVLKQTEQGSWGYSDRNENEISWDKVLEWLEKQSCGNCIIKQAIIDTIETDCSWTMFDEWGNRTPIGECINEAIKRVSSVEPERKKGKWIHWTDDRNDYCTCSECEYGTEGEVLLESVTPYCPMCGADMREVQDGSCE